MKILVINGPNLNLLGKREKNHYGSFSYEDLQMQVKKCAEDMNISVDFFQSNSEGAIVDRLQTATNYDALIINVAAYTHTSIAIRDVLIAINIPFVEVHISNIYTREHFRKFSYLSDIAVGVISGFGIYSYLMAVEYFAAKKGYKEKTL
jgi:3-dehydroquinate dehydratase-2